MVPSDDTARGVGFMNTEGRRLGARGRGGGRELGFTGDGGSVGKMEKSWRWMEVTVIQQRE